MTCVFVSVIIVDPAAGNVVSTVPADNVFELGFSPLGTYLITWQRPSKDANGDAVKNLKVWRVVEGNGDEHAVVGRFVQKSQTGWNLQYTPDEKLCARVVTNEVQFFQSEDLSTVWNKLRVEGVLDFALSPGRNQSIAVFIPERKVCSPVCHDVFLGYTDLLLSRDNRPRSRCLMCLSLVRRCRRRVSSRVTRSS